MKRFAVGLMVAGIAALAVGMGAGAVTTGAPTVSPSSGQPGFTFTVTVQGCVLADSITFAFPPSPPNKVVVCSESSPPPPTSATTTTTVAPTTSTTSTTTSTTTTTTTTTTTEPEKCDPHTEEGCEPVCLPEDDCDFDPCQLPLAQGIRAVPQEIPCCDVLTGGGEALSGCCYELQGAEALQTCDLQGLRRVPGQAASGTTASATFVAPQQPGTYQGTVATGGGVQPFSVTVLGTELPATGSDTTRITGYLAALLLGSGAVLFMVARARRPEALDS